MTREVRVDAETASGRLLGSAWFKVTMKDGVMYADATPLPIVRSGRLARVVAILPEFDCRVPTQCHHDEGLTLYVGDTLVLTPADGRLLTMRHALPMLKGNDNSTAIALAHAFIEEQSKRFQ